MKTLVNKLIVIGFFVFLIGSPLYAKHILGSELTYSETGTSSTYKLSLKVFRDCSECKFNGNGGGSTTQNCQEIPAVNIYGINDHNEWILLTSLNLNRIKINNISTNCASVRNLCQPQSNINYGIEEHILEGNIFLGEYIASGYCKFRFASSVFSRSEEVASSGLPNYFNYSELNFCNQVTIKNSVTFENQPFFYTEINSRYFHSPGINYPNGDSVSVKLVKALTGIENQLNYKSGRSEINPVSFDKNSHFPGSDINGLFFDNRNGNTIFIPDVSDEKGIWVMEFTQWKKNSFGIWMEAGKVRRDFQSVVINSSNNNPNFNINQNTFYVCEGEELCFNIPVSDLWQGSGSGDSVKIYRKSGNFGHLDAINSNNNPVQSGRFCWTPKNSEVRSHPYLMTVEARDNHCPLNGVSQFTYTIFVVKKPTVQIRKKLLNCGNFTVEAVTNEPIATNRFRWQITYPDNKIVNTSGKLINLYYMNGGNVKISLIIDGSNCQVPILDNLELPAFKHPDFTIPNPGQVCFDKNIEIKPQINYIDHPATYLWSDQTSQLNWFGKITDNEMKLSLTVKDKNNCIATKNITISTFEKVPYKLTDTGFCSTDDGVMLLNKLLLIDTSKIQSVTFLNNNGKYNIILTDSGYILDKGTMENNSALIKVIIKDKNGCEQLDTLNILKITPPNIPDNFQSLFCSNQSPVNLYQKFNINTQTGDFVFANSLQLLPGGIVHLDLFKQQSELFLKFISKPHLCGKIFNLSFHLIYPPTPNVFIDEINTICKNSAALKLSSDFENGIWTGLGISGNTFDPSLPEILEGQNYSISYTLEDVNTGCTFSQDYLISIKHVEIIELISQKDSFCDIEEIIELKIYKNGLQIKDVIPELTSTGGTVKYDDKTGIISFTHDRFEGWKNIVANFKDLCAENTPSKDIYISTPPSGTVHSDLNTYCSPNATITLLPSLQNTTSIVWKVNNEKIDNSTSSPDKKFIYKTMESGNFNFSLIATNGQCITEIKHPNSIFIHPAPEPVILSNPVKGVPVDYREVRFNDVGVYTHFPVKRTWIIEGIASGNLDSALYRIYKEEGEILVELYVTDSMGCEGYTNHLLHISSPLDLFIPNAFSPDGGGPEVNNTFKVNVSEAEFFSMNIYNRWGEMVFQTTDPNAAWDGTSNSKLCLPGVYNYYIRVVNQLGGARDFKGALILIR